MQPVPSLAQLQAAGPTAEAWLDDLRRHLVFCFRLASSPETRARIEAKLELLEARSRELLEDSAKSLEAKP